MYQTILGTCLADGKKVIGCFMCMKSVMVVHSLPSPTVELAMRTDVKGNTSVHLTSGRKSQAWPVTPIMAAPHLVFPSPGMSTKTWLTVTLNVVINIVIYTCVVTVVRCKKVPFTIPHWGDKKPRKQTRYHKYNYNCTLNERQTSITVSTFNQ